MPQGRVKGDGLRGDIYNKIRVIAINLYYVSWTPNMKLYYFFAHLKYFRFSVLFFNFGATFG